MTRMTRTACLIWALVFTAGGGQAAQDLLFGSDSLPKATRSSRNVPISKGGKSWEVDVSTEVVSRRFKIPGLTSEKNISAELICPPDPATKIENQRWVLAKGDCSLKFTPEGGVISAEVKLTIAAANTESSKLSTLPSNDPSPKTDQDYVMVNLILEGATASAANDPPSLSLFDQLRRPLLILGIVVVLACMGWLFLKFKRNQEAYRGSAPPPSLPPLPIPTGRQAGISPVEPAMRATAGEETLRIHTRQLLDFESRFRHLETTIQQTTEQWSSMLNKHLEKAYDDLLGIRKQGVQDMAKVESRLAAVESDLRGHLSNQSNRLEDLFKDLPALAQLSTPSRVISDSQLGQLESQFIAAAKHSALSGAELEALRTESTGLMEVIRGFFPAAVILNKDQTQKRLDRVVAGAKVLDNELANLSQLATGQKYGFFVEVSLLEQNALSKDLAEALTREAMKLSDPVGYYRKRIAALNVQACVAAIDLTDLDLDAERRNLGLQEALSKLIRSLGMSQIDPRPNDRLQAADHQVVQFVRRVQGAQPGAIAHTMARGLLHGSEVIRKASVLLYE